MTGGLFQSLGEFSRIQLSDCSRCLSISAGTQIGGELCVILGQGVGKGAFLCAAQFRWTRKSFLKFGQGSQSLPERFGRFRKFLLGFLQLLGDLVELLVDFRLALRDSPGLLQQLAGTRKLWSKLRSTPVLQSLNQAECRQRQQQPECISPRQFWT